MLTDIEIAKAAKMRPITEIGAKLGIGDEYIEPYGKYKAKISEEFIKLCRSRKPGKLILVTAINPTPLGEGKTTTTVGLGQALGKMGVNAAIALREPSLGPVFGIKGGAAGGGYSQVVPMDDINLHFTGDIHAVTSANNLLCAMIDNHLHQGNELGIDQRTILFRRVLDMNDRALRQTIIGLGGETGGIPREDGFMISVASEVMAILCLAEDLADLKKRLGDILIGFTYDKKPVFARQLKADGAMAVLLKDAIRPNLVQTLENTPCFIHGGPFANIAHGCNSVRATKLGLQLCDYLITEAGFGADLGAEKFLDIKCRAAGLAPSAVIIVATVKALKYNGGAAMAGIKEENLAALEKGLPNLAAHIDNIRKYGLPCVVAINRFNTDTDAELAMVSDFCAKNGAKAVCSEVFANGGNGGMELARAALEACEKRSDFRFMYEDSLSPAEKIAAVAKNIYGAADTVIDPAAKRKLAAYEEMGFARLPVCIAKNQYSLSDDPTLLGRPTGHTIHVRDVRLCSGAGFIVALTGTVLTMPGLPKKPAAEIIYIDENGEIVGLS